MDMSYPNYSNQHRFHSLLHETNPTRRGHIHPVATAVLVLAPKPPKGPMLVEVAPKRSQSHLHTNSSPTTRRRTQTKEEKGKNPVRKEVKNPGKQRRMNLALARQKSKGKMMQRILRKLHLGEVTAHWTEPPCTATALSSPIEMPWQIMPRTLPETRSVQ